MIRHFSFKLLRKAAHIKRPADPKKVNYVKATALVPLIQRPASSAVVNTCYCCCAFCRGKSILGAVRTALPVAGLCKALVGRIHAKFTTITCKEIPMRIAPANIFFRKHSLINHQIGTVESVQPCGILQMRPSLPYSYASYQPDVASLGTSAFRHKLRRLLGLCFSDDVTICVSLPIATDHDEQWTSIRLIRGPVSGTLTATQGMHHARLKHALPTPQRGGSGFFHPTTPSKLNDDSNYLLFTPTPCFALIVLSPFSFHLRCLLSVILGRTL